MIDTDIFPDCNGDSICMQEAEDATTKAQYTESQGFTPYEPLATNSWAAVRPHYALLIVLALWIIYVNTTRKFTEYRRNRDNRERRRRAGIPDSDTRPYDVAFREAALQRRKEDEAKQQAELRERANTPLGQMPDAFESKIPYNVRMQGLHNGLVQRFVTHPRTGPFGTPPQIVQYRTQHRLALQEVQAPQRNPYTNGDSATITSSESPPSRGAIPSTWEDHYAPAPIRAANEQARARQAKASMAVPSMLGRRSRKELNLGNDSEMESDIAPRHQRLRGEDWGTGHEGAKDAEFLGRGKTRKRGQDTEVEDEQHNTRAVPRRRVDDPEPEDAHMMPGGLPDTEVPPTPAVVGKRKPEERDEGDAAGAGIDDVEPTQSTRKPRKKAKRSGKAKEKASEPVPQLAQTEPAREVGEEWTADGITYKQGEEGVVLREAVIKEKTTVMSPVRDDSSSPIKRTPSMRTVVHTFKKCWLTPDEFEKAGQEGRISDKFDHDVLMAEVQRQSSPLQGSDLEEDLRSETGQTPLKSGALRTRLGHDRPMTASPALIRAPMTAEQLRKQHMQSPARKPVYSTRRGATMTRTERAMAEEAAWASIRKARAKPKPAPEPVPAKKEPTLVPVAVPAFTPVTTTTKADATAVPVPVPAVPTVPTFTVTPATSTPTPAPAPPSGDAAKPPLFATSTKSTEPMKPVAPSLTVFPSFVAPTSNPASSTSGTSSSGPSTAGAPPSATKSSGPSGMPPTFNFQPVKPAEPKPVETSTTQPNPPSSNPFSGIGATVSSAGLPQKPSVLFGAPPVPLFGAPPAQNATQQNTGSNATPATATKPTFQFSGTFGQPSPAAAGLTPSATTGSPAGSQSQPSGSQSTASSQHTALAPVTAAPSAAVTPAVSTKFSFGSGSVFGTGAGTTGGNLFGNVSSTVATPTATNHGPIIFGAGSQQPATAAAPQPTSAPLSIFGAAKTTTEPPSNASPFGLPQQPQISTPSPFGQSNTSVLGINPTPFGAAPSLNMLTAPPVAGTSTPSAGFSFSGGFGSSQAAPVQPSPFGQTVTIQPSSPAVATPGSAPPSAAVFNIGTPPPQTRPIKGLPTTRSRR